MRFALTPSEAVLWEAIRGRRLGVQFRRQVLIGRFIVDFVAANRRLIVEVDGYHATCRRQDARRHTVLRNAGYRVLHLEANLVLRDLPAALRCIGEALEPLRRAP
jgi:very-short-patch-repair endonuclease